MSNVVCPKCGTENNLSRFDEFLPKYLSGVKLLCKNCWEVLRTYNRAGTPVVRDNQKLGRAK